jgi:hypothetical protein
MSVSLFVNGKAISIDPTKAIGSGGEGYVWDIGGGIALKVFKGPDHPDYAGSDEQAVRDRQGAEYRLKVLQEKLPKFPKMPAQIIAPRELARTKQGSIMGYTMEFLRGAESLRSYSKPGFRNSAGVDNNEMQRILSDLHGLVSSLHASKVQIGDFNNLGVLVLNGRAYLIDADSFQFGKFMCRSFTPRFVDPLLCSPDTMLLAKDCNEASDWYAFATMVFESLTYVSPYGGVLKGELAKKITHDDRPLHRISVFHPDVVYPVKGVPLDRLSDDMLHFYHQLLEKDARGVFPRDLLERTHWSRCLSCGWEHARRTCPACLVNAPSAYFVEDRRGRLIITPVFRTQGRVLSATLEAGKLKYLYHEDGAFKREGGREVTTGELSSKLKVRILGDASIFSERGNVAVLKPGEKPQVEMVDSYRDTFPVFDTNGEHFFRVSGGRLVRSGDLGEKFLARVVSNQTLFWVGSRFGFGTFRVGAMRQSFVFDAESGVQREVVLPPISGDPIDAACYFTSQACWLFLASVERGNTMHDCVVIARDGQVLAHHREKEGQGGWLDSFTGKAAVSLTKSDATTHALLSIGDNGLVRIEVEGGQLSETTRWPDTAGVMRPSDLLLPSAEGLFVVRASEILSLKLQ